MGSLPAVRSDPHGPRSGRPRARSRAGRPGWGAVLALVLLLHLGLAACSRPTRSGPRVLLVTVDDLRADRLGCYGHTRPTSPHLDALADGGLRYHQVLSAAPWSAPGTAALLSGRHPDDLGFTALGSPGLALEPVLLAEALGDAGYSTAAVIGHPFVARRWRLDQGVRDWDESALPGEDEPAALAAVTERALARVTEGEVPDFLWVQYPAPGPPFPTVDPRLGVEPSDSTRFLPGDDLRTLLEQASAATPEEHAQLRLLYDAGVRRVDDELGRLLEAYAARGLLEDTLVVVASPCGYELLERGRIGASTSLFAEQVRVPWVMRGPGVPVGALSDPVSTTDLLPTVLELCDAPCPERCEGVVVLPGHAAPARVLFSMTSRAWELRAVQLGDDKLVRDLESGEQWFFDTDADPEERLDVGVRDAIQRSRLEAYLERRFPPPGAGGGAAAGTGDAGDDAVHAAERDGGAPPR